MRTRDRAARVAARACHAATPGGWSSETRPSRTRIAGERLRDLFAIDHERKRESGAEAVRVARDDALAAVDHQQRARVGEPARGRAARRARRSTLAQRGAVDAGLGLAGRPRLRRPRDAGGAPGAARARLGERGQREREEAVGEERTQRRRREPRAAN